jgi:hypothetical protein
MASLERDDVEPFRPSLEVADRLPDAFEVR